MKAQEKLLREMERTGGGGRNEDKRISSTCILYKNLKLFKCTGISTNSFPVLGRKIIQFVLPFLILSKLTALSRSWR